MKFLNVSIPGAALVLALVGSIALTAFAGDGDDGDGGGGGTEERQCVRQPAVVTGGTCTYTTVTDPTCTPIGTDRVTASSCSPKVTTTPDDSCTGPPSACSPPKQNDAALQSLTEGMKPSVAVGTCVAPATVCTCTANGSKTYNFGRKTCP